MAIDGTSIRPAQFWDKDSKQFVKVNLSVRDIIYFRLIEKLTEAISSHV